MHLKSKKKVSIMLSQVFFRPEVSTTLLCKLWENIPFHWENTSINYSWFEKFSIKVWPLSLSLSAILSLFTYPPIWAGVFLVTAVAGLGVSWSFFRTTVPAVLQRLQWKNVLMFWEILSLTSASYFWYLKMYPSISFDSTKRVHEMKKHFNLPCNR